MKPRKGGVKDTEEERARAPKTRSWGGPSSVYPSVAGPGAADNPPQMSRVCDITRK